MEKIKTTPVKTIGHQSLKTDSLISLNTDISMADLVKKQDQARERHGLKKHAKTPVVEFVPEISVCEKHGEWVSTREGLAIPGRPRKVFRIGCPRCAEEEKEAMDRAIHIEDARRKLMVCGVPKRHAGKSLGDVNTSDPNVAGAAKALSGYMQNFKKIMESGASGFMCGDCGTGKTMFACMIVENAIKSGFGARYITAWNMIQEIRLGYSATDISIVSQVKSFISEDILVIDEIGVQHGTDDERVLLYQVIDGRYNEVKPTIIISNCKNPVKDGYLDARTIDRLKEGGGFSITFRGESYRK